MFRWPKSTHKSTTGYEPKTPKITSIALPDERNSPFKYQPLYTERSSTRNSFFKRFSTADSRPTTPLKRNSIIGGVPQSRLFARTRTVSACVREVEAPRPIRPHPSQGPFIPLSDQLDRVVINPSRGAVEVPSAAFLEEKIERQRMDSAKSRPAPANYMSAHHDGMRKHAEKPIANFNTAPSKAWFQDQEENARRQTASVAPFVPFAEDDDNFQPIPVVNKIPDMTKAPPASNKPLKSALKKTPSIKKQELEPLFKAREYGDTKAYYSENDTDKRRREPLRPYRVTKGPSKAYLEEQQEKLEDLMKQQEAAWHPHARSKQAKDFRPPPFQHSSSSGSPNESVLQKEYSRTRHAGNTEPRIKPSNYIPAYVRDPQTPPQRPMVVEPHLEWPLIEYSRRRHLAEPLVYFDAGFDPREHRYEVCTMTRGHRVPLTKEQRNLVVSTEKIVIKNESLRYWPVVIYPNTSTRLIRVVDVFRAIYDTYAVALTREELAKIGRDYVQRCEPAFLQRCKDAREPTHYLENQGMRRIDLLKGKRIFKGISQQRGSPPHHFELLFDRGD